MRNKRILSFLLAFLMVFSLLPTSLFVYGAGTTNTEAEKGEDAKGDTDGTWGNKGWAEGIRCSLYFAEISSDVASKINTDYKDNVDDGIRWAEKQGLLKYNRIGETVNIRTNDRNDGYSVLYSGENIYDKMVDGCIDESNFYTVTLSDVMTNGNSLKSDWRSKFEKTIGNMFETKTEVDSDRWNKFFLQIDEVKNQEDWEKAKLDYLMPIINKIIDGVPDHIITEENFKNGVLQIVDKNGSGETTQNGIYKFYFEPEFVRKESSKKFVLLTLRDAFSYSKGVVGKTYRDDKNNKDYTFLASCRSWLVTIARSTFINKPEYSINLAGAETIPEIWVEEFKETDSNFYQAGGLGVIYGCTKDQIESFGNPPTVIKTYVKISEVKPDGNGGLDIKYEKYDKAESKMEDAEFYIDKDGNLTNFPLVNAVEHETAYTAYLNDMITIPENSRKYFDVDKTEWVNTLLPQNVSEKSLNADANDISGYKTGLITSNPLFVESFLLDYSKEGIDKVKETAAYAEKILKGMSVALRNMVKNNPALSPFDYIQYLTSPLFVDKFTDLINLATRYSFFLNANNENYSDSLYSAKRKISMISNTDEIWNELVALSLYGASDTDAFLNNFSNNTITLGSIDPLNLNRVYQVDEEYDQYIKENVLEPVLRNLLVGNQKMVANYNNYIAKTPANTLILRYIVVPEPTQTNLVKTYVMKRDGSEPELQSEQVEVVPLTLNGTTAEITPPTFLEDGDEVELVKWVSNPTYPPISVEETNELPKDGNNLEGTTQDLIPNYPIEPVKDNLYVEWKIIKYEDDEAIKVKESVPQWRLSKYLDSIGQKAEGYVSGRMYLPLVPDRGHAGTSLSPTGSYSFDTVNANGKLNDNSLSPANMKMNNIDTSRPQGYSSDMANTIFHSRTVGKSFDSVSHGKPNANIQLDANLNSVKSYDNGKLIVANWIPASYGNLNTIGDYSIKSASLPENYGGSDTILKQANLRVGIYNKDTYDHYYSIYNHYTCHHKRYSHDVCACYQGLQTISPNGTLYVLGAYHVPVQFDRYIQSDTSNRKFTTTPEIKESNAKTSLKYQIDENLTIYPEYGMLLAKDNNDQEIKFVISDKARTLSPVVYQTLEHKVYVVPTVSGSSVATDTRALTQARTIGESGKQVIYKGANVSNTFQLYRTDAKNSKALMTVKTYALDFKDKAKTNNIDVKSIWGNSAYNSYDEHKNLINGINAGNKAAATEKLLVDSPAFGSVDYTGAEKRATTNEYKLVSYGNYTNKVDGGNAVVLTHELVIRGGQLIGVRVGKQNGTNNQTATTVTSMADLKNSNASLYEAILNMNLYNEGNDRSKTVLSTFEYKTGDTLTEGLYATKLAAARQAVDGFATPATAAIKDGDKWYSEDTTVLVIKEYISNYEVPSINIGDKLSMTVNGLNTPTNKAQYFNTMGKGYTYLKYNLSIASPHASLNSVLTNTANQTFNSYFEFTSFPSDTMVNGQQKTDYLVPNVSITDTTRLN